MMINPIPWIDTIGAGDAVLEPLIPGPTVNRGR
jgi:hypothetical protein